MWVREELLPPSISTKENVINGYGCTCGVKQAFVRLTYGPMSVQAMIHFLGRELLL